MLGSRQLGWWGCVLKARVGELDQESNRNYCYFIPILNDNLRKWRGEEKQRRKSRGLEQSTRSMVLETLCQAAKLPIHVLPSSSEWPRPMDLAWESHSSVCKIHESWKHWRMDCSEGRKCRTWADCLWGWVVQRKNAEPTEWWLSIRDERFRGRSWGRKQ